MEVSRVTPRGQAAAMPTPPNTLEMMFRSRFGELSPEWLSQWACDALDAGFDSRSLRMLAASSPGDDRVELERILRVCLEEAGAEDLSESELRLGWGEVLMGRILDRESPVEETLDQIHRDVVSPLQHPPHLLPWCLLWEGLNPLRPYSQLPPDETDAVARELAEMYLRRPTDYADVVERVTGS